MWSFLYQISANVPDSPQIILSKDNTKNVWRISADSDFLLDLKDKNVTINLSNYYFSITKKDDPNVLYRLIRFSDSDEVAFENDFEFDNEEVSVYTMRRFDTYHYEEING